MVRIPTLTNNQERVKLPDGSYVLKITDIYDAPKRKYICLIFDVAEGEYKDYFKKKYEPYFETEKNKDNKIFLSYSSDKALTYSLQKLDAITLSNKDFNAREKWNECLDNPEVLKEFVGKLFGAVIKKKDNFINYADIVTTTGIIRSGRL